MYGSNRILPHPVSSLALGSGPCMEMLRSVSARRERGAGRARRLESERQRL